MSDGDVVLVRFAWRGVEPAALLRLPIAGAAEPEVFRSIDGAEGYAYFSSSPGAAERPDDAWLAALPGSSIARLSLLKAVVGAAAGSAAPYRYVVETDVTAGHEADFNAWYDGEHLAGLASVPGTVRAARHRNAAGHPRYHACYDLVHPDTLGSPAWLAVRATPWSDRVRPAFINTKRTMFERCKTAARTAA